MATPIERKVQELRNNNFNLGNQLTGEFACGFGGYMQRFANVNIYYHPMMGTNAHEVHGGILTKYLSLGGHDVNPSSGERLLGFPITDELDAGADKMCRVSRFEWGGIYWVFGGVTVYGKIYEEYINRQMENGRYGYPIGDPVVISDGSVSFFEFGCMYFGARSHGKVLVINFSFPQLGHPWMIDHSDLSNSAVINFISLKAEMNAITAGHLIEEIFDGRIFLKETSATAEVPLVFYAADMLQTAFSESTDTFSSVIRLHDTAALKNRTLYDIIIKFPAKSHAIAPHSVYIKNNWNDFKFIHATDLHISKRVDGYRKFFRGKGMTNAAENLNNFNDNFREIIQYANILHRLGGLDLIIITGDLVDYVFEDGGQTFQNNNFVYFEEIIRGLTGKPDQVENVELIVPILTSLGNHDYRTRAYYPLFRVDIQWPISNRTIEQYFQLNLTREEAEILTEQFLHITEMVSSDTAIDMIRPDRNNAYGRLNYYFRHICRETSYVVTLGEHQIIMIDGKWDAGTIEDTWDAIKYAFGFRSEATRNYVAGSPDSIGFYDNELELLRQALRKTGLVIVGVHAPLVNPNGNEYPWFFREYIRSSNPLPYEEEMKKFLFIRNSAAFQTFSWPDDEYVTYDPNANVYRNWSRTHTFYFNEGDGSDMLDFSVMLGNRKEFLDLCTGLNHQRPVDLVLSGHVHKNWECRILVNPANQKFQFSHEFFTENPSTFYFFKGLKGHFTRPISFAKQSAETLNDFIKERLINIFPQITDTAGTEEKPVQYTDKVWLVKTKPYPLTLNSQPNLERRKWWWGLVRPLFIQTAASGPSEYLRAEIKNPDFRGCRLISVDSGTISKIQYVTRDVIRANMSGQLVNAEAEPTSPNR